MELKQSVRLCGGIETMSETESAESYRGHVKREFDCGHWILIPDDFGRWDHCPHCPGEFVREVTPDGSDFEEATWT